MSNDQMQVAAKKLQDSVAILARVDKMQIASPEAVQERIESEKLHFGSRRTWRKLPRS
jgi:hypothetical protein